MVAAAAAAQVDVAQGAAAARAPGAGPSRATATSATSLGLAGMAAGERKGRSEAMEFAGVTFMCAEEKVEH